MSKSKVKESSVSTPDALSRKSSTKKVERKSSGTESPKKVISIMKAPVDKAGNQVKPKDSAVKKKKPAKKSKKASRYKSKLIDAEAVESYDEDAVSSDQPHYGTDSDEEDSQEMQDFLVDDEELQKEEAIIAQLKREQRKKPKARDSQDGSDEPSPIKKRKAKKIEDSSEGDPDELDSEDKELVQENLGKSIAAAINPELAEKKHTKKLRRVGALEQSEDDAQPKKEAKSRQQAQKADEKMEDLDIDGDDNPFNTKADKEIMEKDIPERLQTKLEYSDTGLVEEAKWIIYRLTTMPGDLSTRYFPLAGLAMETGIQKIRQVLEMLKKAPYHDVPHIVRNQKHMFEPELDEAGVWHVFNLDQEYGKFMRQKSKIEEVLKNVQNFDPKMELHIQSLQVARSQSELNNYTYLIRFLQSYYSKELEQLDQKEEKKVEQRQKIQPSKRDDVKVARAYKLDEFAAKCLLPWHEYQENLLSYLTFSQNQYGGHQEAFQIAHQPPDPAVKPMNLAEEYQADANSPFNETLKLLKGVCRLASQELAAQPTIRKMFKQELKENGFLSTHPTEQGKKDLDIFHPSYRCKHIVQDKISDFQMKEDYLAIAQCEAEGLIKVTLSRDPIQQQFDGQMQEQLTPSQQTEVNLRNLYCSSEGDASWNILRGEVIKETLKRMMTGDEQNELEREVRQELREEAELVVLNKCKQAYKELLMTGPFTVTNEQPNDGYGAPVPQTPTTPGRKKVLAQANQDMIKQRERINVMGAIMQQIDQHNYVITVAIADQQGELITYKDFNHLLVPRRRGPPPNERDPKRPDPPKTEEEKEHDKNKVSFQEMLKFYKIDLVVVSANSLDAKKVKDQMQKLCNVEQSGKEVSVIWGRPEVPKLFAASHNSQKLHKNLTLIIKQAISLCRFEQDPLAEVLNLWSSISAENKALALNLHNHQKLVSQVKLVEALEEVNVQVVNEIGLDLNFIVQHEHLHAQLQFISGLGPRKAKSIIDRLKNITEIGTRTQLFTQQLMGRCVFLSCASFLKIKIYNQQQAIKFLPLDQTRIHNEQYKLATQILEESCIDEELLAITDSKQKSHRILIDFIQNPEKLDIVDCGKFEEQLLLKNQPLLKFHVKSIVKELKAPFTDSRRERFYDPNSKQPNLPISTKDLLYMMLDETERTFREGMIVTATVQKVFDSEQSSDNSRNARAICRLENGLRATIEEKNIVEQQGERLRDKVDPGAIVSGRIESIICNSIDFEVTLACKQSQLKNHDNYIKCLTGLQNNQVPEEDKKNQNFQVDTTVKPQGRFKPRRIAFEKFKNISSRRAALELQDADIGDFLFRPSTRSDNSITLTWKYYKKTLMHIDIQEIDKQEGAAIGNRLHISNESFDTLREIVERYIIPCNRLLREVTSHAKFCEGIDTYQDLSDLVANEKKANPATIPYRFGVLSAYPGHVVLVYVPKEKVVKEFIRVKPMGFFFHDTYLTPFQALINWFKDNWRDRAYQRVLKRARSPRTTARGPVAGLTTENQGMIDQRQEMNMGQQSAVHDWGGGGGGSVHSHGGQSAYRQQEAQKSFGRGGGGGFVGRANDGYGTPGRSGRDEGAKSPNQWGAQPANSYPQNNWNQEQRPQAPTYEQDRGQSSPPRGGRGDRFAMKCYRCQQDGHMARDCTNEDTRERSRFSGAPGERPSIVTCYSCHQEGHMSRECPNNANRPPQREDRGPGACFRCHQIGHKAQDCPNDPRGGDGYKRQRGEDGRSVPREEGGGYSRGYGSPQSPNNQGGQPQQQNQNQQQQQPSWGGQSGPTLGGGWDERS